MSSSSTAAMPSAAAVPSTSMPHHQHPPFPMERVLYNLHYQICSYALRKTSTYIRNLLERFVLILAVCGFGALLIAHVSFVHRGGEGSTSTNTITTNAFVASNTTTTVTSSRGNLRNIPLTCLSSIPGFSNDADIIYLSILDDNDVDANARMDSFAYYIKPNHQQSCTSVCKNYEDDAVNFCHFADRGVEGLVKTDTDMHGSSSSCPNAVVPSTSLVEKYPMLYSYSRTKGYLLLPLHLATVRLRLKVQHVLISKSDVRCFGEPFLQRLVFRMIGPDTVMINWLLALNDGREGYVYNPRTETMITLNEGTAGSTVNERIRQTDNRGRRRNLGWYYRQIVSKIALVLKTSFLFFITTTLVSFTLRETQERMLDFTQQLQVHVRTHRPVVQLVIRHVVENLVFIPIMVGMMFFLNEFYHDEKFLAFTAVSLVWVCEVFSLVSLRTSQGIHFFPRIFFLLFSLFHFYLFSFPFGFSYMALVSTICFLTHSMVFFWHRYELPAIAHGVINLEHPRMAALASASSPSSIPSLASTAAEQAHGHTVNNINSNSTQFPHEVPNFNLPPRVFRQQSLTSSSAGRISRPTSSGGLFHRGGEDNDGDESSYMYFLEGEIVMHRRAQSPGTPGSGSGSQIHSSGSLDDNSTANNTRHTPLAEVNNQCVDTPGRIPERIVIQPSASLTGYLVGTEDRRRNNTQRQQTLVDDTSHVDAPEMSSLHAILYHQSTSDETPRTDNLSSSAQYHTLSQVRAAPTFPSLSSSGNRSRGQED